MISIKGKQIFIHNEFGEVIETTNPELIGLAILDSLNESSEEIDRNKNLSIKELKQKYIQFLNNNKMSVTTERKLLIDLLLKIDNFEPYDLINEAMKSEVKIVPATCYNFLKTCVDSGILEIQPKKYFLKK